MPPPPGPSRSPTARAPVRLRGASAPGQAPPGWPVDVPPPGADGWQARAASWLLDVCPPDYRGHPVLARQPRVLARLAVLHASAQLDGLRRAVATLRADLSDVVGPRVVDEALAALEAERVRLLAVEEGAVLVERALAGARVVPSL
ncbi:hypothetical protein WDZ17_04415 [Pseudokineococcus basanitobsidens]|uniref:Uncharacterized protein n=1 Tax=Pseudokineococcus basanitobsidens TaxID=1926649 RepID=A0ABU8RHH7_9ACTN